MDFEVLIISVVCAPTFQCSRGPFRRWLSPSAGRPLRIFHLLAPASFGGLERVVYGLAAGQKEAGHDVRAVMLLETGVAEPSLIGELDNVKVPVIRLTNPARSFRAQRRALRDVCAQLAPDVLHTHGYLPDVLAASLGLHVGFARVSTVHGFTGGGWRNRLYEWMQRRSYFWLDAVVAVSRKLAADLAFATSSHRQVHALANAWSPAQPLMSRESARQALDISKDAFNVAWVGRISREKALDVLIEALPALRDLPLHITVIGDGAERTKLERRAVELQIAHRVSWRGETSRAFRLFPAFDLFVNSSRTEGTPITLFEAMHAGVPIVATAVGGVPDVISSKEAILIQPEDPAALASAIRRVYDEPVDATLRAVRARERLENEFAAAPWIDSYGRIYEMAIAARASR